MAEYLYFEGACGISGDMIVASLLDLGGNKNKLDKVLKSLQLDGFAYHIEQKSSYSICGCDFDVHLRQAPHHQEEHYHEHHHEHRHLSDVYEIIDRGEMTDNARQLAKKIFLIVAEAESRAHGCAPDEVHFHEVGAVDSIVDIISVAVLIDDLQIKNVIVSGLCEGQGFVTCQHGVLPVPVPAVVNIAEKYGIILRPTDNNGEMVTPTGIAVAAALKTAEKLPASYKILKTGIGLGKRDFGHANFLRTMLIEDTAAENQTYVIETNIDDATAEELGLVMEKLLAAGAADVHFEPCFMKKNRPAYMLRVVADTGCLSRLEEIIFCNTTTIGLRKYAVERRRMERKIIKVELPYGTAEVKKCWLNNIVRYYPEYESIKALAAKTGDSYRSVYAKAVRAAEEQDAC
ncbi:MAG: nickel pincer cofactor biosynthesis protein LarC [Pseudomonadota bacterium]|nr:nickel pincer cofactor biosynthesis protein LarC [Pseudomonadota bacterium]